MKSLNRNSWNTTFSRNIRMSISRSLNFSLFQSSSKEEDFDEEDEEDDYDWGNIMHLCIKLNGYFSEKLPLQSNLHNFWMIDGLPKYRKTDFLTKFIKLFRRHGILQISCSLYFSAFRFWLLTSYFLVIASYALEKVEQRYFERQKDILQSFPN